MYKSIIKKSLSVIMIAALLFSLIPNFNFGIRKAYAAGPSGTGTKNDPYQISTAADLQWITTNYMSKVNGVELYKSYFVQTADIDLSGIANFVPIGEPSNSYGIVGTYDGGWHTISNLKITSTPDDFVGLIKIVNDGGSVRNLRIANVNINIPERKDFVGAITGKNYGIIENCSVTSGSIVCGNDTKVGGIAGFNYGTINSCYNVSNLSVGISSGSVSIEGGIAADTSNGIVQDCWNSGNLTSQDIKWVNIGGIVGNTNKVNSVKNCYSTGAVTSGASPAALATPGGIAGHAFTGNCLSNFYLSSKCARGIGYCDNIGPSDSGANPKTDAELKTDVTYSGWDSSDTWVITNGQYPQLLTTAHTPAATGAVAANGGITINWNKAKRAGGYRIYWSTTSGTYDTNRYKEAFGYEATSTTITDLSGGNTYYFVVKAVGDADALSSSSNEVSGDLALSNSISISVSSVTAGGSVTLTAVGDRQGASGIFIGEERHIPKTWSSTESGKTGIFTLSEEKYTSTYTTSSAGNYTITITFQKQRWDGTSWADIAGATDTKTTTLKVNAGATENVDVLGGVLNDGNLKVTVSDGIIDVKRYSNGSFEDQYYRYDGSGGYYEASGIVIDINGKLFAIGPYFAKCAFEGRIVKDMPIVSSVSQTADVNSVTTVWQADVLQITQKVTLPYDTAQYIKMEWEIKNTDTSGVSNLHFLRGEDTYLGGDDSGAGFWDATINAIGVEKTVSGVKRRLFMQGITTPNSYSSKDYQLIGVEVNDGGTLSNTINTALDTDNGYALEWSKDSLAAGSSWAVKAYESFVNAAVTASGESKTVAAASVGSGVVLSFNVTNASSSTQNITYSVKGPDGWTAVPARASDTLDGGASAALDVTVTPPGGISAGVYEIILNVTGSGSQAQAVGSIIIGGEATTPGLANGLSFTDPAGIANNGKTQITLGASSVVGNTFKYIISSDNNAVPTPIVGYDAGSWTAVVNGEKIAVSNGKHIGVAEVDGSGKVVQFTDATAVVADDTLAPVLTNGLSFTDPAGIADNGKTKITLGAPSVVGNTFKYIISSDSNAVPTPIVGFNAGSWAVVANGDKITVTNGKHIGVAEVDGSGKVVQFTDATAVVVDDTLAPVLANGLSFTDPAGIADNSKTQITLGAPSVGGNTFRYLVSSDDNAVPTPIVGFNAGSWTTVANGDKITVSNGKHIGVAEVDGTNKVVQFTDATAVVVDDTLAPVLTGGLSFTDPAGIADNGKTQITLGTPSVGGNTFRYLVSSDDNAVPTPIVGFNAGSWTAVANGDKITVSNGKHIGVAEVDGTNKVVQFTDATAVVVDDTLAPVLTGGLSFTDPAGIADNGKTQITLGTPSVGGNTFRYLVSSDDNAVPTPIVGFNAGSWTAVANGDKITVSNCKHIGVAEVDGSGKVVQFSDVTAVVVDVLCTVSFSTDGGSAVADQSVNYNAKATKPSNPIKAGYTFAGWYKEAALTNVFDFDTETITANITIYAKWANIPPPSVTIPTTPPTTVIGSVIDGNTGTQVSNVTATVTTDSNGNSTVSMDAAQTVVLKEPDGNTSQLSDMSKVAITTETGAPIIISADGTIKVENLPKGTDNNFTVTYDLGNGQKITIGTLNIKIDSNGNVNLTSTLIDPYGIITDATTGKVINGVNLVLYYANTDRNIASGKTPDTVVPLPEIDGFKPNNNKNPQVSDAAGAYGFMVFPNSDYYIVAVKDGYNEYKSPIISVEKEIVKWDFKMHKTGAERLFGQSRVDTALEIAKTIFANNISNIILATSENYPDALAGSVLAYKLNAPILLVGSSALDQEKILSYLKDNMNPSGTVYILGGSGAVSTDMEAKVAASGFKNIKRLGGADRYETSVKIAEVLGINTGTTIVLSSGDNYPDALSISSTAALKQYPILLVSKDGVSGSVMKEISKIYPSKVYIIGLQGVISSAVEDQVAQTTSIDKANIVRIGGADRFETSLEVAKYFNLPGDIICVATGNNFPDALAGSIYAALNNAPIILVDKNLSDNQMAYLKNRGMSGATIFGGEGAVSKDILQKLSQLFE